MKIIDTKAHQAKQAMDKLLNAENNIYKPWQLHKHSLSPIRLVTTKEEFSVYLFLDAFVRPGFEVEDGVAQIPHLFCKLDGSVDDMIIELQKLKRANSEKVEILHGFNKMNKKPTTSFFETKPGWYDDETGIDIDAAFMDTINSLGHLRPKYRYNFLEAVNRVLEAVKSDALLINPPTPRVVLETLIYNSAIVVDMYHRFDYQFMVPKFIVIDSSQYGLNPYGALRLMLMNELGFDVVIVSKDSYSSIENVISPDEYELYIVGDDEGALFLDKETPEKSKNKLKNYFAYGFIFLLLGFIIYYLIT